MQHTRVKVSGRYQIAIPSSARQQLNIRAGDRLLVDIQDGLLILMPEPTDFVAQMAGLHRTIWQNMDTTEYLQRERQAWLPSNSG
jgi:AbrB family looped-hinge helix DNA binding protein